MLDAGSVFPVFSAWDVLQSNTASFPLGAAWLTSQFRSWQNASATGESIHLSGEYPAQTPPQPTVRTLLLVLFYVVVVGEEVLKCSHWDSLYSSSIQTALQTNSV